ncbi:S-adenosyl-L-methionine-dependent methyltransferase [Exidia glandulosa HHB12029]|uniref:S-adenosyl-L-methionine-dependent methyltransferase n=1 Tax=Exidia glandulosa HHB12029 TaxID=1314781 RepID=A0A165ELC8_EXIGL|nr:S-adenosyl-L-methionine-dependent methyltransferase [Exidia glandulosa HHB12029]
MADSILSLADIVNRSAQTIDGLCRKHNAKFPDPNEPFDVRTEEIRNNAEVLAAAATLTAAAEQLVASVWLPGPTLIHSGLAFHVSAALRVAITCHVAESLREAGPQGAHVDRICEGLVVRPQKLGRILRLLSTKHIFREVSPEVFANNRLSSLLDTGKSVTELRTNPNAKYENSSNPLPALFEHSTDEVMKTASYLAEVITDPAMAASDEPDNVAFSIAMRTDKDWWKWAESPENSMYLQRFSLAMSAAKQVMPEQTTVEGFDWGSLPKDATVVDAGGGVGAASLALARAFPDLRLVVQDRTKTIEQARGYWEKHMPEGIASGRITLEAHDFFDAVQPRGAADVYLLRFILHDWADSYCLKILDPLRKVAGPNTTLIIVDTVLPYACRNSNDSDDETTPLLANLGAVNLQGYLVDMQMLTLLNGQERTAEQFDRLLLQAGWRVERFSKNHIVAKPV